MDFEKWTVENGMGMAWHGMGWDGHGNGGSCVRYRDRYIWYTWYLKDWRGKRRGGFMYVHILLVFTVTHFLSFSFSTGIKFVVIVFCTNCIYLVLLSALYYNMTVMYSIVLHFFPCLNKV